MAKLLKNNLIFLHIPKTGGNWLKKILLEEGLVERSIEHKHASFELVCGNLRAGRQRTNPVRHIARHVLTRRNWVFFSVVRNPLKWYESWFKYQKSKDFKDWGSDTSLYEWHVTSPLNGIKSEEFNAFVSAIHEKAPGYVTQLFTSFVPSQSVIALKNETIREDFLSFCERFDLTVNEANVRQSKPFGVSPAADIEWERAVFERTVELEKAAFVRFGYQWEGIVNVGG